MQEQTGTQAQQEIDLGWVKEMDELSAGDFFKFQDEEEVVLKIASEPKKGISRFPWPDGSSKTEYVFDVIEDGTTKVLKWPVSSRAVLQQIVAIMKKEKLSRITGCKLKVIVMGSGKERKYFLKLVSKPGSEKAGA